MESNIHFVDVTLRDAHQCLWSTRMTTGMMTPILSVIDKAGFDHLNILGGAVFDVCVRYLQENPWERMRIISENIQNTRLDALTRGQSLYTFKLFSDDIVRLNMKCLAASGIDHVTIYDALNDIRNLEVSAQAAREEGMTVHAQMVYTLSPVHTDEYYVERTKELVRLGADHIGIKDPTGLLTPERGKTLFPAVKKAAQGRPIELHSHCQSGLAPKVYAEAIKSGITFLHTAVEPLANGASLPAVEEVSEYARALGYKTNLNQDYVKEMSGYFRWLCYRENKPMGEVAEFDPALYEHQVPGGMISNLKSQLKDMNMEHKLDEILEEAAQVRKDLGYPILVSPFAQYVITQSVLNVIQGERYKTVPDEVRKYILGHYGKLAGEPSKEFLEKADIDLRDARKERAGTYLEPEIPALREEYGSAMDDEELLLAAFFDDDLRKGIRPPENYSFHTSPLTELVKYVEGVKNTRTFISYKGLNMEMTSKQ